MGRLCGDLALLAAIGQVYGRPHPAQDLYCLAQYGCGLSLAMDPGDVAIGLDLIGLDAFRLVAPGLAVPRVVTLALAEGHIVLGQLKPRSARDLDRWTALFDADTEGWRGIVCGWDMVSQGISSSSGYTLTGHYVVLANPVPGWEA